MLRPKRNEWQMTFVGSAQAALDALKAEPCEVVVTDMRMPGMSGAELLEVVQREYPDTIRLILSGQAETESVMKALGVSHQFLSKPCDAEILQGTIARAFTLRDLAGNPAVKTLVARINKLPTLPATYQQLVECLKSPTADMDDVAKIISHDPSMSARLLKVVNSAYFGLAKPVADVARAGALLGLDRIMALVLGQGIFSGGEMPQVRGFSLEALWAHSLATATAAHRIAIEEGPRQGKGGRGLPRRHAARHRQAGARHGHARTNTPACWSWRRAGPAANATSRRWSCRPRTPTWAPTWSGCGACRTRSPKPSPFTKTRRSRPATFGLPGIVHVADRIAHHPDIADPRTPELHLNFDYLEKHERGGKWNEWREICAAAIAQGSPRERPRPLRRRRTQRARRHPSPAAQPRRAGNGDQCRGRARHHQGAGPVRRGGLRHAHAGDGRRAFPRQGQRDRAADGAHGAHAARPTSNPPSPPSTRAAYSASCSSPATRKPCSASSRTASSSTG